MTDILPDTITSLGQVANVAGTAVCKSCKFKKIIIWILLFIILVGGIYSLVVSMLYFVGCKKEKFTDDIDDDGDLYDPAVFKKIDENDKDYTVKNMVNANSCSCRKNN